MVSSLFGESSWSAARFPWEAGDRLVLVTDGVTEARRGSEEFGEERLRARVAAGRSLAGSSLAGSILAEVREFVPRDGFEDDLTLMVVTDPR